MGKVIKAAGVKYDEGKNQMQLIPVEVLQDIGLVFTHGAKKYGEYNWLKGMKWSRFIGATLRHFFAWCRGAKKDKESGLHPLLHAIVSLMMLYIYEKHSIGIDDRTFVGKDWNSDDPTSATAADEITTAECGPINSRKRPSPDANTTTNGSSK